MVNIWRVGGAKYGKIWCFLPCKHTSRGTDGQIHTKLLPVACSGSEINCLDFGHKWSTLGRRAVPNMVKYGLFELCCKLTVCYSAFWNFFRRKLGDVEICPYMVKCPYLVLEGF